MQVTLEIIQEVSGVTTTSLLFPRRTALHLEPVVNGRISKLKKIFRILGEMVLSTQAVSISILVVATLKLSY